MTGDAAKFLALMFLVAASLLLADAAPCLSRDQPGPAVVIAAGPGKHVIKAGDTLGLLALRYGVPTPAILKANPGLNPSRLALGREIVIPTGAKAAGETSPAPAPLAAPAGGGIELRPEKAPQATPPLRVHDLPDAPAKAAAVPRDQPQSEPSRTPASAGAQTVAAPAAKEAADALPAANEAAKAPAAPAHDGWPAWGVVAAVGGLCVLALAFHGAIGNLAAAVTLRALRPFRVGDAVTMAGIVGRVESMGAWYVAIRSESGERVYVPNAKAAGEIVVVSRPGGKGTVTEAPRQMRRG